MRKNSLLSHWAIDIFRPTSRIQGEERLTMIRLITLLLQVQPTSYPGLKTPAKKRQKITATRTNIAGARVEWTFVLLIEIFKWWVLWSVWTAAAAAAVTGKRWCVDEILNYIKPDHHYHEVPAHVKRLHHLHHHYHQHYHHHHHHHYHHHQHQHLFNTSSTQTNKDPHRYITLLCFTHQVKWSGANSPYLLNT